MFAVEDHYKAHVLMGDIRILTIATSAGSTCLIPNIWKLQTETERLEVYSSFSTVHPSKLNLLS